MIEVVKGDMFSHNLDILVNTVNCVGVMGKGIALEFKKRYPDYFERYKTLCDKNQIKPGNCIVHFRKQKPDIISFPTKYHWKNPSKLEWIKKGLESLKYQIFVISNLILKPLGGKMPSVGIPALGCTNGGLDWNVVRPLIIESLKDINNRVLLFEPHE